MSNLLCSSTVVAMYTCVFHMDIVTQDFKLWGGPTIPHPQSKFLPSVFISHYGGPLDCFCMKAWLVTLAWIHIHTNHGWVTCIFNCYQDTSNVSNICKITWQIYKVEKKLLISFQLCVTGSSYIYAEVSPTWWFGDGNYWKRWLDFIVITYI